MTRMERMLLLRKGGDVVRWHGEVWTGPRQTVGHHTFGVLLLLFDIAPDSIAPCLIQAALYHDLAEQIIGDIPAPTKWALRDFGKAVSDLESGVLRRLKVDTGGLTLWDRQLLKVADFLEVCFAATEQYLRGNITSLMLFRRLEKVGQQILESENAPQKALSLYHELRSIWMRAREKQGGILCTVASLDARECNTSVDVSRVRAGGRSKSKGTVTSTSKRKKRSNRSKR